MIRFFLLQNKQGKTRLSKWYSTPPEDAERVKMESDVHRVISMRGKGYTNFVEYQNFKLIYRRYAGLYFCFGVDVTDNELLLMETIHLFVELLDQYFSNVCEVCVLFFLLIFFLNFFLNISISNLSQLFYIPIISWTSCFTLTRCTASLMSLS